MPRLAGATPGAHRRRRGHRSELPHAERGPVQEKWIESGPALARSVDQPHHEAASLRLVTSRSELGLCNATLCGADRSHGAPRGTLRRLHVKRLYGWRACDGRCSAHGDGEQR